MGMFARHGGLTKGDHHIEGINSRLDGLQAAILLVKLPHLAGWTRRRQELAASYESLLHGIDCLGLPVTAHGREHVFHLYVIQHENRDALAHHLNGLGIQTVISYPTALPFLPAYSRLGHQPADFPNAYRNQSRILSIPIFSEMTQAQQDSVAAAMRSFPV
jgi:dTDP-4-amino-4,6-dideoxygalactose transaminase